MRDFLADECEIAWFNGEFLPLAGISISPSIGASSSPTVCTRGCDGTHAPECSGSRIICGGCG